MIKKQTKKSVNQLIPLYKSRSLSIWNSITLNIKIKPRKYLGIDFKALGIFKKKLKL